MRDLSWKVFAMTGDVDAYLLYKEMSGPEESGETEQLEETDPIEESF